eukprot:jgi/Ulvmu1/11862/UM081_0020.1
MSGRGAPVGEIKNKQPADQQITAEQVLREAKELQLEDQYTKPKQVISDQHELDEYRLRERKKFEDEVRRVGRIAFGIWVKYATFEEKQKDLRRARNVWERALHTAQHHLTFWLKYAEMEMRNGMVNHARNVWSRATQVLPRVDQLWYKWIHMEEMVGQIENARQIFEKWMKWEPDHHGWMAYIKFEVRGSEIARAREVFERYVACLPGTKAWVRFAKFEAENGDLGRSRQVYERALQVLEGEEDIESLYVHFAEFEEFCKEPERVRAIYRYALDHVDRDAADGLYARFVAFEKKHGDRGHIEDVLLSKKRLQYEEQVAAEPLNYDAWFDYIKLEESLSGPDVVRGVYERAVENIPPLATKLHWCRYVYLWIYYAVYEEVVAGDAARAREVYRSCLKIIPHAQFTFAKVWILAAKLELRQKRLKAARTILGMAIGKAPKPKLFKAYIDLEAQLAQVDRVRTLYGKFIEFDPTNVTAWVMFAEVEGSLQEEERARSLHELALSQPVLNQPEALWMHYIDYELSIGDRPAARALYERLLERTQHVKVWISYAYFEATPTEVLVAEGELEEGETEADHAARVAQLRAAVPEETWAEHEEAAREVYVRAFNRMRENEPDAKAEAALLLEEWLRFEKGSRGDAAQQAARVEAVEKKLPKTVKKKRRIEAPEGMDMGMEEYLDYVFPEEDQAAPLAKLLAAAERWKQQKSAGGDGGGGAV